MWRMLENRREPSTVVEFLMCCASGASHGSSKWSSTTSIRGQTARWGSHGSASGSVSIARASAPVDQRVPGNGNSMLAQTPSCRPGWRPGAPRAAASTSARCRGWGPRPPRRHGILERIGDESRSIATSASARSDRWTCSTPAEYVGGVLRPAGPASPPAGRPAEGGSTPCRCWRRPRAAPRWSAA